MAVQARENPFAEIEAALEKPPADGIFVTHVEEEKCGCVPLQAKDVITAVEGKALLSMGEYYKAMRPKDSKDESRKLEVLRAGKKVELTMAPTVRGYDVAAVKKGQPGWEQIPDFEEAPDFSVFERGVDCWLRNSLGERLAGYEHIQIKPAGDAFDFDIRFRLGGNEGGKIWDYNTHAKARYGRNISMTRSSFVEKNEDKETKNSAVELHADQWRGNKIVDGKRQSIANPAFSPMLSSYTSTLMPIVMPLRKGASFTFYSMFDGTGQITGRMRLLCEGKRTVKTDGKDTPAWCFAWKHYGQRPPEEEEKFYVSDDRRLLRVEWGANYSNCWGELLPKEKALQGIPEHVRKSV